MIRFFSFLFLFVIIAIIALLSLLFIYQKEVKAAILDELNKHLKAEVKVDPNNIDLTIIKSFPFCSIQFDNVLMLEALPIKNRDTLIFAKKLSLYFNIKDLLSKNYEIKRIKLNDAVARIKILRNGKANYVFWEEAPKTGEKKNTDFNLNLITLEKVKFQYDDQHSDFSSQVDIKSLSFKGHFKENAYDLAAKGKLYVYQVRNGDTKFLKNKTCNIDMVLGVNQSDYVFSKANVSINKLALQVNGKLRYEANLESMNLSFHAPDPDISSVLSLLPPQYLAKISDYKSSGIIYAKGTFNYSRNKSFRLKSEFGLRKATITYKPLSTTAQEVNLEGEFIYSNTETKLDLKKLRLKLREDEVLAACSISDFSDPSINLSANADINLQNLQNFLPIDTLSALSGSVSLRANVKGRWKDLRQEIVSDKVNLAVDADITQLEAQVKGDEKTYRVEECKLSVKDRDVEVRNLKFRRGNSDLTLSGKVSGVLNYIAHKESAIAMTGSLQSDYVHLEDFMLNTGTNKTGDEKPLIPSNVYFKLDARIAKFSFHKFEATSVSGDLEIKSQKAVANEVRLETMDGRASINAYADNSGGRLDVIIESNLQNINITKLFEQFNNFGQTSLVDKNIRGRASANIDFSGSWNTALEVDPKSIVAQGNLQITNGELINFEPMMQLSKFADVEDLKRIKFSNFQSQVQIKDQVISFPKTQIKNSLLNVEASGTHNFDNYVDYHIQLLLSEYLAKKRKKNDSEFGPVENDPENRRSAYIRMKGPADNPDISYDRQGLKEKMKEDWKQEKQTVKQILKKEFGFFKKDTTVKKESKPEPVFELEKPEQPKPKKTLEVKKKKEEEDF